ncbi:uncharacterized protein [Pempheris klunzingeri]|uniref:uncharacterized protein n=1 Tax=Pempheris klunzingeri TaxID=3127111 RepID=UPI00397F782F
MNGPAGRHKVVAMLTRPLTLTESDDRGRGLAALTPPPVLPLADEAGDDDITQRGVFSPPVPPWSTSSSSSSSSSPSSPPPPPPSSSSAPLTPLSFLSSPSLITLSSKSPPPLPSSSSAPPVSILPAPFVSPPPFSRFSPLPSSSPLPPSLRPSPPSFSLHPVCTPPPPTHDPLPFSSAPSPPPPPLLYHHSSSLFPPPPPPVFFTPCTPYTSSISSPLSSSSPPDSASLLSPLPPPSAAPPPVPPSPCPSSPPPPPAAASHLPPPVAPPLPPYPTPPPPCCPCSSLLPRLLSAHRLEVRRLLRGALASLSRRLDSLERSSRRKRMKKTKQRGEEGEGAACPPGLAAFSPASSCSPAHTPPVSSSSSSLDGEDSTTHPLSSALSQQRRRRRSRGGEGEGMGRKRRRKNHRAREKNVSPERREDEEEEEDAGRFVGRMVVSFRGAGGAEEEAPITLHNFNHRKHRRGEGGAAGQSEKALTVVRQNGYSSTPQNALHLLQLTQGELTCSQSEVLSVSSGQWRFSDFPPPVAVSSNHSAFRLCLSSSSFFSPAPMLRLSAVSMKTMSESLRGGACGGSLRPLKDWTAPPSLSSDHCYIRTLTPSPTFSARRQLKPRANHSSRSLHLPRRRALPLPPCSANGLSAPLATGQSAAGSDFLSTNGERGKRVSQIRIRRASPRETLLTPMGLPKVKRLKKKEFSLEEIYTNKNYKSPSTNRSLETIFEEPREKDGALLLTGQQRRRRLLLFPDFTQPRKRKRPQGAGLPVATVPRKRAAARRQCNGNGPGDDESDLDVMLVERLSALEDFLTRQGLDV